MHAFAELGLPVVLPVHPRLKKMLERFELSLPPTVRAIEPVGFLDLLALLEGSAVVVTDSGGLQKEAYMLRRQCVTVRDTTEWVETVTSGWNRLVEPESLKRAVAEALAPPRRAPRSLRHAGRLGPDRAAARAGQSSDPLTRELGRVPLLELGARALVLLHEAIDEPDDLVVVEGRALEHARVQDRERRLMARLLRRRPPGAERSGSGWT